MRSGDREEVVAAFDAVAAGLDRVLDLDFEALSTPERLALLHRCETLRRRLPAAEHPLIAGLVASADPAELGGTLPWALADRLHITRGEARRRIDHATELGPRRTLTGQPLQPALPATAAGQRTGRLNDEHIRVIRGFFARLPADVDPDTAAHAEAHLADLAAEYRPDQLAKLAARLFDCLVPAGLFSDADRANRRELILGRQHSDGMTPISGQLTPEARATLDAVLAKLAAPGMCNPADENPCVSGTPSQDAIESDRRSAGQRNHDAVSALARAMLASGDLGSHNGLPATIIVSTSLADLQAGAGKARTGGGGWLPMKDVIRLAGQAHHYLRIFDGAKEVALYHTKRLATPGQRVVLHARDRGCTHPGCDVPGDFCEAHHLDDYARTGRTDIDGLTWRCGPHHKLITSGGWRTRRRKNGAIETIPPPHLDHGQPRTNHYHHPEHLLLRQNGRSDSRADGDGGDGGDDDP